MLDCNSGTEDIDLENGEIVEEAQAPVKKGHRDKGAMYKKYGPYFIWGQLNAWYKQTISDPTSSLSSERRGTIALPDIESCFVAAKNRYTAKVNIMKPSTNVSFQTCNSFISRYISDFSQI